MTPRKGQVPSTPAGVTFLDYHSLLGAGHHEVVTSLEPSVRLGAEHM